MFERLPEGAIHLALVKNMWYNLKELGKYRRCKFMKHVKTLSSSTLKESMKKGGCGECQTSCQSACKTSCTVGNQSCENSNR